jgi:polar amino acid transport system permease protein
MAALWELLPGLLPGLWVTTELASLASIIALCAAAGAGLARHSPLRWLRWLAASYVELFRGTSALVQLYFAYFVLPLLGVEIGAMTAGVWALGLNAGAYGAEAVRGSIAAVPAGQWEASAVLGMSRRAALLRVIVPQALPRALPPLNNVLIELLKNTSLASLITLSDLTFEAQSLRAATLRTSEVFALLLAFYFTLSLLVTALFRWLERMAGELLGNPRSAP